jgi:hypothetical protein
VSTIIVPPSSPEPGTNSHLEEACGHVAHPLMYWPCSVLTNPSLLKTPNVHAKSAFDHLKSLVIYAEVEYRHADRGIVLGVLWKVCYSCGNSINNFCSSHSKPPLTPSFWMNFDFNGSIRQALYLTKGRTPVSVSIWKAVRQRLPVPTMMAGP